MSNAKQSTLEACESVWVQVLHELSTLSLPSLRLFLEHLQVTQLLSLGTTVATLFAYSARPQQTNDPSGRMAARTQAEA